MIEIILWALTVYLLQLILPSSLGLLNKTVDAGYLLGARDTSPELATHILRIKRAAANMGESLPAFLALAILSIIGGAANAELATYWLALRVVYVLAYWVHISAVRTLVWLASIACLVMMALNLV
jgi:uncharacterized MAPEG superfamily protein